MSRYTVISIDQSLVEKKREFLRESIDKTLEKYTGNCCYYTFITPYLVILLSNGLNEKSHIDLFNELNATCPGIRLASITHEVPINAIYKALQVIAKTSFYYEHGIENDYLIGHLIPEYKGSDPLEDLVITTNLLSNALLVILRSGSIPLHIDLGGLIAVLNEYSIDQLNLLRPYYRISLVRYKYASPISKQII
ncbi:MAG: hypothetical protein QXE81_02540 [Desulfurococcaceae archaeon]